MDKYTSGVFASTKYGIYKSAQDIIMSLPATIIADGQNASAVVKGNMSQSGTPTPSSPIYPTECGDLSSGNYIIPVISGGVTTNVDLSVVQATRYVAKKVLTGAENYTKNDAGNPNNYLYYASRGSILPGNMNEICVCNQLQYRSGAPINNIGITTKNESNVIYINFGSDIMNAQTSGNTVAGLKEYLAAQYALGTPVTIWYILSSPTTTPLNEPIRKIGDYADSVSVSAIPTTVGSQTFDIDTILKPSEVDLTYNGWHLYNDKKYTSGAWS